MQAGAVSERTPGREEGHHTRSKWSARGQERFALIQRRRLRCRYDRSWSKESAAMTLKATTEPVPLAADGEGSIRIGGTRVTLDNLLAHFEAGATPQQIVEQLDTLRLADVYLVRGYCLRHPQRGAEGRARAIRTRRACQSVGLGREAITARFSGRPH